MARSTGSWPHGGGTMRTLIRRHDWAETPLGPIETWPSGMRTTIDLVLGNGFPMVVLWGSELIQIYNDGYAAILGNKHPAGLGRPTREVWPEVWHINKPIYDRVWKGETCTFEDALYPLSRGGVLTNAWFTLTYNPVWDDRGAVAGIQVTIFETTAQHLAQRALRESEQRFRALVTAGTFMMYRMSPDWRQMYQLSGRDILADTVEPIEDWADNYLPPDDRPAIFAAIDEAIRTKSLFELEHRVNRADGGIGWVVSRAVPILGPDGEIVEWFGTGTDVTERREALDRLRSSEAAYRAELMRQVDERPAELMSSRDLLQATMDSSMDMIQVFAAIRDEAGEIVDFRWLLNNHTSESKYGEVRGESLLERNPGVVQEDIFGAFKRVTESGKAEIAEHYYPHEQFNGWFLQSVVKLGDGVATTTKDITDWKSAPDEVLRLQDQIARSKLEESEQKYRQLFDAMDEGYALCEVVRDARGDAVDYRFVEVNPAFEKLTGLSASQVKGRLRSEAIPIPDERTLTMAAEAVASGRPNRFEYFNEGLGQWYEVGLFPHEDDRFASLFANITERKQADLELKAELAAMVRLHKLAQRVVVESDLTVLLGLILDAAVEMSAAQFGNVQLLDPASGKLRIAVSQGFEQPFLDAFAAVDAADVSACGRALTLRQSVEITDTERDEEFRPRVEDARRAGFRAVLSTPLVGSDGEPIGMLSTHWREPHHLSEREKRLNDICARLASVAVRSHTAHAALQESEERLRQFGEASSDVIWIRNARSLQLEYLSPAFETIYGLGVEEALKGDNFKGWARIIVPEDRDRSLECIAEVLEGKRVRFEYRIRRPVDGRIRWLRNSDFPICDTKGHVIRIGGIGQDVTKLKEAEAALHESEKRLRQFAEHSAHILWDLDLETETLTHLGARFKMLWGSAVNVPTRLHDWMQSIYHEDRDRVARALDQVRLGEVVVEEYRILRPDRTIRWLRDTFFPIRSAEGRVRRIGGLMQDITQQDGHFVYAIDSNNASAESLAGMLRSAGYNVRRFTSAAGFLAAAPALAPGCVVCDVGDPGSGGVAVLRDIKAQRVDLPVIVIGDPGGDVLYGVRAIKAGAADFLSIPYTREDLLAAVASVTNRVQARETKGQEADQAKARIHSLPERERAVLEGLLAGGTNKTIALDLGLSPRTVEIYRARVMQRLDVQTLPQLVLLAAKAGVEPKTQVGALFEDEE
ncbi:PAS domain-containing protein [Microvirga pudoricolor]|uniref:PAS domain-containing protein n=1 Tax=Microvirga pudoricolor TaxID=2778729 RepID=UPI00195250EF|nr:PAS domain-containing protein [Microvirga pudoricolor]MBM6595610.1 PAS domain-containing protein [Microvirga pudoricolor]